MDANAAILLVREDGSIILQERDDKPEITNPGLISTFGGRIEKGEAPLDAAVREINEETNLGLTHAQLHFYRKYSKTKLKHGEDWDVYYFVARDIDDKNLKVYEGTGYTTIKNKEELAKAPRVTILLREVLTDLFEGRRAYVLFPDMSEQETAVFIESYYQKIIAERGNTTSTNSKVAIAPVGRTASGKSSVTEPLADVVGAIRVSSDDIRQRLFEARRNFDAVPQIITHVARKVVQAGHNIFLDFDVAKQHDLLEFLRSKGYRLFIVHANPPEEFIIDKIMSGKARRNARRLFTFFPKDEYILESLHMWKEDHKKGLSELKFPVWRTVDTSSPNLPKIIQKMVIELKNELDISH